MAVRNSPGSGHTLFQWPPVNHWPLAGTQVMLPATHEIFGKEQTTSWCNLLGELFPSWTLIFPSLSLREASLLCAPDFLIDLK